MRKFFMLFVLCAVAGCAMHPVCVQLHASSALNPDKNYRSLPVVAHIYQLREKAPFMRASFMTLWHTPQQTLGQSFVAQESVVLDPGETRIIRMHAAHETHYIGVTAIFREPSSEHWKVVKALTKTVPFVPEQITLHLVGNRIYVR